jgi:2-dehydrotetronate isomerase
MGTRDSALWHHGELSAFNEAIFIMSTSLKACAHLGFQFNEFEGLERIAQAARAGFRAVEWPAIYDFERSAFMQAVKASGLAWAQVTLRLGHAGEKGITALPGREVQFQADLELAINYALELKAPFIHPMSGVNCPLDDPAYRAAYVRNLRLAVQRAHAVGLKVLVEVISETTVTGYAMSNYALARGIFDEVPGLHLLLDTYHAAVIEGDVCQTIAAWGAQIGHVQIADMPGRHEPGTGQLDFGAIEASLQQVGYRSYLGCEYKPEISTLEGLKHLQHHGWL